jgi:hypothetical protein
VIRKTFEAAFRWLVPAWLLAFDGDAIMRTIARTLDENVARFREGLEARFPERAVATDGALAKLGKDRGIPRGRTEAAEHYAGRLVEWRYPRGHRVRGSAWALLAQVSEYWGSIPCFTVDASGNRYARTGTGFEYVTHGTVWDWDAQPTSNWARFWVVIDGAGVFGATGAWPTFASTPGTTIGQTGATVDDVAAMRRLMTGMAWRPAGTQPEWILVALSALGIETFDETFDETFGDEFPAPAVTWERWSAIVGGVQEPVRSAAYRYWSLAPAHNNTYGGNDAQFCAASRMPDGTTYAGDPTSFPLTEPLPGGRTYAGDATKFATSVLLPDDGSFPA